jgi:hypothetical protein
VAEIVDLHGRSIAIEDDELIENLARFADGTLSQDSVKSRHHLDSLQKLSQLSPTLTYHRVRSDFRRSERLEGRRSNHGSQEAG